MKKSAKKPVAAPVPAPKAAKAPKAPAKKTAAPAKKKASAATEPPATFISAQIDIGFGNHLAIRGEGVKAIVGLISSEPFFREPREQKRDPATILLDNIPGRDVVYVRWIVEGEGTVEVEVRSIKGGTDKKASS